MSYGGTLIEKLTYGLVGAIVGVIVGSSILWYSVSGQLAEGDRIAGEYDRLRRTIAEERGGIVNQVGVVGQRIETLGAGLSEVAGIAERARSESVGVVETLKKLVGAFKIIQERVGAMEMDLARLRSDYNHLLLIVGGKVEK